MTKHKSGVSSFFIGCRNLGLIFVENAQREFAIIGNKWQIIGRRVGGFDEHINFEF